MYFRQFLDPGSGILSYLVADEASRQAFIIDPGPDTCQSVVLRALLDERRLQLTAILLTHIHGDSADMLGCLYPDVPLHAGAASHGHAPWATLQDEDRIPFAGSALRVIATPGHTPCSMSYLWQDRLFCGHALLPGTCSRAEDGDCDPGTLFDSVIRRLFLLPDETLVFPGQDAGGRSVSTIGEERRHNPAFLARSRDVFVTAFRQGERLAEGAG